MTIEIHVTGLSDVIERQVETLFLPTARHEVRRMLVEQCGRNLPALESASIEALDRIRLAALKLGEGDVNRLVSAIALANDDWRDLLVAAGFAEDTDAHKTI